MRSAVNSGKAMDREATAQALERAALTLIERNGVLAGPNLREVADVAGVNRGLVYHPAAQCPPSVQQRRSHCAAHRHPLNLSATQFGAISSRFFLLFSLSAVGVGFLSNRVSTTKFLGIIAVLWSIAALPVLIFATVPMLFLSRIALGAAEGPTFPIACTPCRSGSARNRARFPPR